jgi:hypothetical protein
MRPVYPNESRVQYGDADPIVVNPSTLSSDIILLPPGAQGRRLAPGEIVIINTVIQARTFVTITGSFRAAVKMKPLNALFFRNDTGRGDFPKVASLATTEQVTSDNETTILFLGQITQTDFPNLFPGFFMGGIRNPKANPEILLFGFSVLGT